MKRIAVLAAGIAAIISVPASAAIVSLASDVDFSGTPVTVHIGGNDATYTFSYTPYSYSPVSIAMTGSAEVYGNGFLSRNAPDSLQLGTLVPDQLSLGEFFQVSGSAPIAYSFVLVNLALRFVTGGQTYYGYAQTLGPTLTQLAYNDTPNGAISTGEAPAAVPEPASWAMMIGGFGLVGATMRRRKVAVSFA